MKEGERGAAIRAGFEALLSSHIICLDADLSYDAAHISEILDCFKQDPQTDVVVVSAYMKGGTVEGVPWVKLFISKMANWLLAGSFGLSTVTCCVRGYRGDLVRSMSFSEDGKEFHLEILRKLMARGANVVEIPGRLVWRDRTNERRRAERSFLRSVLGHIRYGFHTPTNSPNEMK